jgi:hypothetical protein
MALEQYEATLIARAAHLLQVGNGNVEIATYGRGEQQKQRRGGAKPERRVGVTERLSLDQNHEK